MGLLGKLVLKMSADSAQFQSEMKRAKKSAKSFGEQSAMAGKYAGAAMAAAGTASIAAAAVIVKSNLASIDVLAKTADKLGMSTEALAGMRHAAELTGVSQAGLDKSMVKMLRSVGEAQNGIGTARLELDKMGLSADALAAMKPEQAFAAIAEATNEMSTQSEKAAAAAAIFGREGVSLLNTMRLGKDGLAETAAEAEVLGLALSRIDAAKVEAANDAMTRMNAGASGFGMTLTAAVSPYIKAVADELTAASLKSDGFRTQIASAMEYATSGVIMLGKGFYGLELVWDALQYSFLSMERFIQEGLRQIGATALDVVKMANVGGIFDDQVAAGQQILGQQAQIVAQIEADQQAVLASGAKTLTQYDELEAKVRSYKAAILDASQTAAEDVAANAPGNTTSKGTDTLTGQTGSADVAGLAAALAARDAAEKAADAAKYVGKLAALENYLATEDGRLFNAAVRRAEMVLLAHEAGQISETAQNVLLEQIAADHETKLAAIKEKGLAERNKYQEMSGKQQAKSVAGSMQTMLGVAGKHSKKMEKINRAAAVVDATISMWQGVAAGVKLGYPAAIPAVAAAFAQGGVALANLGGSGSAASAGISDTAQTVDPLDGQSTEPEQEMTIRIVGMARDAFIEDEIIPGLDDAGRRNIKIEYVEAV